MDCPALILSCLWLICLGANASKVVQLLDRIRQESHFEYLLLMKNRNATVPDQAWNGSSLAMELMHELKVPALQLDENVSYFLHNSISNRLVSVVYLSNGRLEEHDGLLKALVANLRHMTTSRVVFLMEVKVASEGLLLELFSHCWKMKMLNVLVLFADHERTHTFYRYSPFPNLHMEESLYEPNSTLEIFPNRLRNFLGYRMPMIIGGTSPRMIAYYKRGKLVYEGTVGHFMDVFQRKYNFSFVQPLRPTSPTVFAPSMQTVAAVRNNSVEMSMSLTFPTIPPFGFTYPYEQMNWCLMLPVEADVPTPEYYTRVFDLQAFLVALSTLVVISSLLAMTLWLHGYQVAPYDFLLHESCLRGVLGQSFVEVLRAPTLVRGIYLEICVLGILITAWYNSYFSAYVTAAPKQLPYRSYDDLFASRMKVVAWTPEYAELIGRLAEFRRYDSMFMVVPDFSRYISLRDSFNTKYGYMMHTTKWMVVAEQQKVFSKPLFRMREDFCFFNNIPFGFPIHENSVFIEPILTLIMELAETGLSLHWMQSAFSELIDAGELHFLDLSPLREFRAMQLMDLQYVWYGFAFMSALSSIVWLLEVVVVRHRRHTQSRRLAK
ncbi:uncharacterized protein LOC117899503 [Drosophila subobscura]|uniref:uncharacterized protein LOC117899503 n=1 Tax=Drosophila subobscura TaxID=7241 RepID=UPI00155A22BE|nr:uncharacterized protein LOC117899503 [Drosophila subobscura]